MGPLTIAIIRIIWQLPLTFLVNGSLLNSRIKSKVHTQFLMDYYFMAIVNIERSVFKH